MNKLKLSFQRFKKRTQRGKKCCIVIEKISWNYFMMLYNLIHLNLDIIISYMWRRKIRGRWCSGTALASHEGVSVLIPIISWPFSSNRWELITIYSCKDVCLVVIHILAYFSDSCILFWVSHFSNNYRG